MLRTLLACVVLVTTSMAQTVNQPDVKAQRDAMKKLHFLVGNWSGEAHIFRANGEALDLLQTEQAEYKLDGLLLVIEGVGRSKSDGHAALQALGIISYDEATGVYRMRAYNDGRSMETDVKFAEKGNTLTWGFEVGEVKTTSTLRINDNGDWTELHEIAFGSQPSRKFMDLRVSPQK
jgi:hypothetical protein